MLYKLRGNLYEKTQNIQYIRGKIKKDITLDRSRYWIIDGDVTLYDGVIMIIKPGTQVEFKNYSTLNADHGLLISKGTDNDPVSLFGYGMISGGMGWNLIEESKVGSALLDPPSQFIYTEIVSLDFDVSYCDHCKIFSRGYGTHRNVIELKNSIVYCPTYRCDYDTFETYYNSENCLFNWLNANYYNE